MFYQPVQRQQQQQRGGEERLNLTHQLLPSQIKPSEDGFLSVSPPKHLDFH